jgi:hypothetical protein
MTKHQAERLSCANKKQLRDPATNVGFDRPRRSSTKVGRALSRRQSLYRTGRFILLVGCQHRSWAIEEDAGAHLARVNGPRHQAGAGDDVAPELPISRLDVLY